MEKPYPSIEFETEVLPNGMIKVPKKITAKLRHGSPVTIRLTQGVVSQSLRERNITESEVEKIAFLQLEQRENVLRFLRADGSLSMNRAFRKRADALLGRRR